VGQRAKGLATLAREQSQENQHDSEKIRGGLDPLGDVGDYATHCLRRVPFAPDGVGAIDDGRLEGDEAVAMNRVARAIVDDGQVIRSWCMNPRALRSSTSSLRAH